METRQLPDLRADKHGYVLFDCPDCRRVAKLKLQVIRATYRAETGMAPILEIAAPNDCKAVACRFRVKPHPQAKPLPGNPEP
jgi:hypothetical protein